MTRIRHLLSAGDEQQQLRDEMKILPKDERDKLTKDANFSVYVPPEQGLAMKADMSLPWNKLRMMRRYNHVHVHNILHLYNIILV